MSTQEGRAIKAARALRGLKQEELAVLLNEQLPNLRRPFNKQAVSNMENGHKTVTLQILGALAVICELPLDFFVYGPAGYRAQMGYFSQTLEDLQELAV